MLGKGHPPPPPPPLRRTTGGGGGEGTLGHRVGSWGTPRLCRELVILCSEIKEVWKVGDEGKKKG